MIGFNGSGRQLSAEQRVAAVSGQVRCHRTRQRLAD